MTTFFSRPCRPGILAACALSLVLVAGAARGAETCGEIGQWVMPGSADVVPPDRLVREMAERPVVLLGESHTSAEDHRWQLHMLAALHARHPGMVIGFEMFPRKAQPVLDQWVAGELRVDAFLTAVDWGGVWGYDAALYLPLFHFARQNRIPMRAINIDRKIIAAIGARGWANVPEAERGGITDPAPASADYRARLERIFKQHDGDEEPAGRTAEEVDPAALERFVEAQLAWDRAMAQGLAQARGADPQALIVGIVGRGHLEFGYGIPHQLADLGIAMSAVLLTAEAKGACPELSDGLADAVFLVAPGDTIQRKKRRLRLGVVIEAGEGGVRVTRVAEDSAAAAAALRAGDIIVMAAGVPVHKVSELIAIVARQAPGTWLPLEIRRADETIDIVAKFPAESGDGK